MFSLLLFAAFAFIALSVFFSLRYYRKSSNVNRPPNSQLHVCLVLGSGGHTTEILRLVSVLSPAYNPRSYVMAESDLMSEKKALETENLRGSGQFSIHKIPRSREVRQSYITSILTTVKSIIYAIPIVCSVKPDLVLVNGPGTCIPVCVVAYLMDLFAIKYCQIIFIESVCRVRNLSLSGHILYWLHLTDLFLVQWPQLQQKYSRTVFIGRL